MKFKITTLGCKVNTYESEYMLEQLKSSGFVYDQENPEIVIINTCSVTNVADAKSKKIVRRIKRTYPESILVVCGCSSQNNQEEYENLDIDILLGNRKKSDIVSIINNYLETKSPFKYFTNERKLDFEDMEVEKFTTHTRAFIKIEDGCNNFCSYCIIPYTRGSIRCKKFDDVISEANVLVKNGHQEIVLTGIHTGAYHDNGHDLNDILEELCKIDGLKRIRLSSIEITELNSRFMEILKNPKICNHLHIPLQSGSKHVLEVMNRKYDKTYFKNKVSMIRSIRPDISLTTDVIVGHPYETDEDFLECFEFCKEINFSKIHVFPYSKRDGTKSSEMPEVKDELKKSRVQKLLLLSQDLEHKYYSSYVGKEVEVLTEEYFHDYTVGHTSNYLKVYIKGALNLNHTYTCEIITLDDDILIGKIIN